MRRSFDVILLLILLSARLRINSFAEASLFEHFQNVIAHPLLGGWLPAGAVEAFGPWFGDPIFLLLAAMSLLAFIVYILTDMLGDERHDKWRYRIKLGLLWIIVLALVILPTIKLVLLRQANLPHSYSHDGGVIQTEATISFFLTGRNPYTADYRSTPMADWGYPEFRTALDHYPYLPSTFILSAPVYQISSIILGWYDQRFTYLILFIITLILLPKMVIHPRDRLALFMIIALNPIMGVDILFGQNDLFVLAWFVFALYFLQRRRYWLSSVMLALACAAKPTAWFLVPFWALALLHDQALSWRTLWGYSGLLLRRAWPALITLGLFIVPYLIWDANALIDDVWRWSAGTTESHYQIWGWGFANFILASGTLPDRFAYWPFWVPELLVSIPALIFLATRQMRHNTTSLVSWHGATLLLLFAYVSRFLNENYLGFLLALFALGYFVVDRLPAGSTPPDLPQSATHLAESGQA